MAVFIFRASIDELAPQSKVIHQHGEDVSHNTIVWEQVNYKILEYYVQGIIDMPVAKLMCDDFVTTLHLFKDQLLFGFNQLEMKRISDLMSEYDTLQPSQRIAAIDELVDTTKLTDFNYFQLHMLQIQEYMKLKKYRTAYQTCVLLEQFYHDLDDSHRQLIDNAHIRQERVQSRKNGSPTGIIPQSDKFVHTSDDLIDLMTKSYEKISDQAAIDIHYMLLSQVTSVHLRSDQFVLLALAYERTGQIDRVMDCIDEVRGLSDHHIETNKDCIGRSVLNGNRVLTFSQHLIRMIARRIVLKHDIADSYVFPADDFKLDIDLPFQIKNNLATIIVEGYHKSIPQLLDLLEDDRIEKFSGIINFSDDFNEITRNLEQFRQNDPSDIMDTALTIVATTIDLYIRFILNRTDGLETEITDFLESVQKLDSNQIFMVEILSYGIDNWISEHHIPVELPVLYVLLYNLYRKQGEMIEAEIVISRFGQHARTYSNDTWIGRYHNEYANFCYATEVYGTAISNYSIAASILDNKEHLRIIHTNLVRSYLQMGELLTADDQMDKVIAITETLEDSSHIIQAILLRTQLLIFDGKIDEAMELLGGMRGKYDLLDDQLVEYNLLHSKLQYKLGISIDTDFETSIDDHRTQIIGIMSNLQEVRTADEINHLFEKLKSIEEDDTSKYDIHHMLSLFLEWINAVEIQTEDERRIIEYILQEIYDWSYNLRSITATYMMRYIISELMRKHLITVDDTMISDLDRLQEESAITLERDTKLDHYLEIFVTNELMNIDIDLTAKYTSHIISMIQLSQLGE